RARLVEFKYTKSGRKARVKAIGAPPPRAVKKPSGPLFTPAAPLIKETAPVKWATEDPHRRANITVCDVNGDGAPDVYITMAVQTPGGAGTALLLGNPGGGGWTPAADHPLVGVLQVNAALWGDLDNDGLTDVYLCRTGPNQLWRQVEKGRWQDIAAAAKTAGDSLDTVDGALFDADHDGDLDLFLINADGPNALLNNNRNGTFRPLARDLGLTGNGVPSRSLVTTDLDGDRDVDLVIINARPPHEVYRNERMWRYEKYKGWEAFLSADVAAAAAGDVDADGQVELYTLNASGSLSRWTPGEDGAWKSVSPGGPLPAPTPPGGAPRPWLALADVDGEGAPDLIMTTSDGWLTAAMDKGRLIPLFTAMHGAGPSPLALLASASGPHVLGWTPGRPPHGWPAGENGRRFVSLELSGKEDHSESMRSNASGIGARVAARVGSRWTVTSTFRDHSGPGQGLQPLMVGLGQADKIDFVAIDWSDGVYQTEMDLPAGARRRITETQRQLSSCPVLFAWDGKKHRFVSDILGVGGMGYAVGPGEYASPRPWENLMLPEGLPAPKGGRLILKLTEPMEEATYLDAAGLKAYDLPPGWSMTLDERMGISAPEPTGAPRFYRRVLTPLKAVNDRGRDVTASVIAQDLRAAPAGDLDHRFIGRLQKDHLLTLTFSEVIDAAKGSPMLLADGWVEYPYSQTNFAAWQAGAAYRAPTLEARGPDQAWRVILPQFGYPAGMPRQMSLPLPPLPPGARWIRLRTNQEVYWDRLQIAYAEPCPNVEVHHLPLIAARLERIGFPKRTDGAQRLPHYDYRRRLPFWDVRYMEGYYTRLGPVKELIAEQDNAVAIFGPGDGLQLEFSPAPSPLKPGWTRIHVIETRGWCKDMDLYTLDGETVGPIPFIGKRAARVEKLHQAYNTRFQSGQ
ncbi:MAG: CRTAC1 family protein, partial [Desulfobacterales bacterium]|nr:CRTAC1 family protein [Desulfobacterales bacterium]